MNNTSAVLRSLIIYAICIPLAILLGYSLAEPLRYSSIAVVGLCLVTMALPLWFKWHHSLTIICWNLAMVAFFLPGKLSLGLVIAVVSLFFSVISRSLLNQKTSISCPSVSYPLIALAVVTLVTLRATGGLHAQAFGSEEWGAGRYFGILAAILGYFALVARPVTPGSEFPLASLFFLSGVTAIWPVLIILAGPSFYVLLALFPSTMGAGMSYGGFGEGIDIFQRYVGVTFMAEAILWFMMLRYGIRGILDWRHSWRWMSFLVVSAVGLLGGFRSFVVIMVLLFVVQFFLEGLHRTRMVAVVLMAAVFGFSFLFSFADRFPMPVQRSLAFLPIKLDPMAKRDAAGTLDWRLQMWRVVFPEVPKYLFAGKGYNFNSTDYLLTRTAMRRGIYSAYESTMVSGDYHNGILTLIIPLGIYGFVAFLAFCAGALRVLYANYRYGPPKLQRINTFLLSYFVVRLIFYLFLYGEFYLDLMIFTGVIGLSLCLNHGVCQKTGGAVPLQAGEDLRLQPA